VHITLGLTDDMEEMGEGGAVTLVPGLRVLGVVDLVVRQRLGNGWLAFLGLADVRSLVFSDLQKKRLMCVAFREQSFDTSMTTSLAQVLPDPQIGLLSSNNEIPFGPNIATLRLSARTKATSWRVRQDYREKSLFSGVAAVGGLGSFFGTVFAMLFGTTILGVMFGEFISLPRAIRRLKFVFQCQV